MDKNSAKRSPQKDLLNCWEVMMCGREKGGKNFARLPPTSHLTESIPVNAGADSVGRLQGRFVTGACRDRLPISAPPV